MLKRIEVNFKDFENKAIFHISYIHSAIMAEM
jgi:hypothetical protein